MATEMSPSLHVCARCRAEQFSTDGFFTTDDETEKGNERKRAGSGFLTRLLLALCHTF